MKDLVQAILGGKHCAWCTDKPDTFFERAFRFDQIVHGIRPLHERIAMRVYDFNTEHLQTWRIGQWWHYRFHASPEERKYHYS